MATHLQIELNHKPHPYPDEPGAPFDAWGRLSLSIILPYEKRLLVQREWAMARFADWFLVSENALCAECLSIAGWTPLPSESLAHALRRFQERDFAVDEEHAMFCWVDAIYAYRQHHSLRFALPGTNIQDIIIGRNHGRGEISLSQGDDGEEHTWSYAFDMNAFCINVKYELRDFFENQLIITKNRTAYKHFDQVYQRLTES